LIEGSGSHLVFNGSASADTTTSVKFQGTGLFALNHSGNYTGSVSGFGVGDSIDVTDVGFVPDRDSYNPGTDILSVSNGTHTTKIQLVGVYTANDFVFGSDGDGGTLVSWHGHTIV
jgi:large repetitive protein